MTSYFLLAPDLSHVASGSYAECITLGDHFTLSNAFPLLKIARARAGEPDATIIYDISKDSRKQVRGARRISRQRLVRTSKQTPFPA